MGGSISVSNPEDNLEKNESERRRFMTKAAIEYCRNHLYTMSPMLMTPLPGGSILMQVDEARAAELGGPIIIGRIGAPYMVVFDVRNGDIMVYVPSNLHIAGVNGLPHF